MLWFVGCISDSHQRFTSFELINFQCTMPEPSAKLRPYRKYYRLFFECALRPSQRRIARPRKRHPAPSPLPSPVSFNHPIIFWSHLFEFLCVTVSPTTPIAKDNSDSKLYSAPRTFRSQKLFLTLSCQFKSPDHVLKLFFSNPSLRSVRFRSLVRNS